MTKTLSHPRRTSLSANDLWERGLEEEADYVRRHYGEGEQTLTQDLVEKLLNTPYKLFRLPNDERLIRMLLSSDQYTQYQVECQQIEAEYERHEQELVREFEPQYNRLALITAGMATLAVFSPWIGMWIYSHGNLDSVMGHDTESIVFWLGSYLTIELVFFWLLKPVFKKTGKRTPKAVR